MRGKSYVGETGKSMKVQKLSKFQAFMLVDPDCLPWLALKKRSSKRSRL